MKFSRLATIAHKEFLHIIRDWRSLYLGIAIPIFLLCLFGYALTLDVDQVPMVVWDQSNTPASRELLSRFDGSRYFLLVKKVGDYREIEKAIDYSHAIVALIIPENFAENLQANRKTEIQFIVDGSDSNTATIAMGYGEAIAAEYSNQLMVKNLQKAGKPVPAYPIDLRPRTWYNPSLQSKNAIVPGLIAVIMMVIAALLTSLTIAREWEQGTMEQLIATPVKVPELLLGKMAPYFIMGMFDVLLVVLIGEFVFHIPLKGSLFLLFTMAAIFLVGSLSLGMLISTIAKSQLVATQLAMIATLMPSFLLSGFFTTINNMPTFIQYVTYLIPARYLIFLLKSIYLKGVGISILWKEALLLILFSLIMMLATRLKFKKKLV